MDDPTSILQQQILQSKAAEEESKIAQPAAVEESQPAAKPAFMNLAADNNEQSEQINVDKLDPSEKDNITTS